MKGLLHQIPLQERHHLTSQKKHFFSSSQRHTTTQKVLSKDYFLRRKGSKLLFFGQRVF